VKSTAHVDIPAKVSSSYTVVFALAQPHATRMTLAMVILIIMMPPVCVDEFKARLPCWSVLSIERPA
jgi:hypothetical protein